MQKVVVSGPGKLMLFGEHAVVYGRPCIVTTVNHRLFVSVEKISEAAMRGQAQNERFSLPLNSLVIENIPKKLKFLAVTVALFAKRYPFAGGVKIYTRSQFSPLYGFGSSSAVTCAAAKALFELFEVPYEENSLFEFCFEVVTRIEGLRSGFDIAAAIYGATLFYVANPRKIEILPVTDLPMIVGYTGIKADTPSLIAQVGRLKAQKSEFVEKVFSNIETITRSARLALEEMNWEKAGALMNQNHEELKTLEISSEKLDTLVMAAQSAGAWGAKLSGAGGGDCMVALVSREKRQSVIEAIEKNGGQVIDTVINVDGVMVESNDTSHFARTALAM